MTVYSSIKHNPVPHPLPPVNTWAPAENKKITLGPTLRHFSPQPTPHPNLNSTATHHVCYCSLPLDKSPWDNTTTQITAADQILHVAYWVFGAASQSQFYGCISFSSPGAVQTITLQFIQVLKAPPYLKAAFFNNKSPDWKLLPTVPLIILIMFLPASVGNTVTYQLLSSGIAPGLPPPTPKS